MSATRVLVARQDSLGDVLLAGPAIRAVKAGGAHVTLLCGPRGRAAAELLPDVECVWEWRADWIDPEPRPVERARIKRFLDAVAAQEFHQALVLTSFHQSPLPLALLLRMAGIRHLAAICDDYPGSLLDVRHRVPSDLHEVERGLSLVQACDYRLPTGDNGCLRVCGLPAAHPAAAAAIPYIVVHPGASVQARAWPVHRHGELVRLLLAQGRNVVVTGGPDERELTADVCRLAGGDGSDGNGAQSVAGESGTAPGARQGTHPHRGRLVDLGGLTDLRGLAATIAGAEQIVVGNTGPAHLAAAVGTAVVSLYAPTVPAARWRPWGVAHRLLQVQVPCAGCRARRCPVPGHPCMEEIHAEEVLAMVNELAPVQEAVAA